MAGRMCGGIDVLTQGAMSVFRKSHFYKVNLGFDTGGRKALKYSLLVRILVSSSCSAYRNCFVRLQSWWTKFQGPRPNMYVCMYNLLGAFNLSTLVLSKYLTPDLDWSVFSTDLHNSWIHIPATFDDAYMRYKNGSIIQMALGLGGYWGRPRVNAGRSTDMPNLHH